MDDTSTSADRDGRLGAIYEFAPDAYYLSDLQGNFVDGNRAAEDAVGYRRQELIGKNFLSLNLLSPQDVGRAAELLAKSSRGEFVGPVDFVLNRKDGSQVPVEIRTRPITIEGRQLVLGIARDTSDRKAAEETIQRGQADLKRAHAQLERRVAQRTAQLEAANARLRAEIAQKEKAQSAAQAILQGAVSEVGEDFFASFVEEIARSLEVTYVLVCEHLDTPLTRVRTLAFWGPDGLADEIEYDLAGGPCAVTATGEMTFYPRGIQSLFPDDHDLVEMRAESYCGFALRNRVGSIIGHLALLDTRPMEINLCKTPVLQVFVARAAAELERELATRGMQASEQRHRTLVESAPLCIHEIDLQGRILSMNSAGLRMLGAQDVDEVVGRDYLELVADTDRARIRDLLQRAVDGKESNFEFTAELDGVEVFIASCFIPLRDKDGHVIRLMGISQDITERTRAERALHAMKERLDLALNATSDGVWDWNIETGEVIFSPQWFRSLGYEPGELAPDVSSWERLVHPDDMPRVQEQLEAHFQEGTEIYECENRLLTKSGAWRWNLDRGRVVARDESGRPLRMVGTDADITRRKLAEEQLKQSEAQLRLITDAMPGLISYIGADRCFQFANRGYEEFFGMKQSEILGQPVWRVLGEKTYRDIHKRIDSALAGNRESYEAVVEVEGHGKRILRIEYIPDIAPDGRVRGSCTLALDITQRRQAEELAQRHRDDLAHVSRVATVGEMATGLAHELNQPLSAIATYADVCLSTLLRSPDDSAAVLPILEKIKRQSLRAGSIVHRLRRFLRKKSFAREPLRINRLVDDVLGLLSVELNELDIAVDVRLPESLPELSGDTVQIEQVLLNLVRNSVDAIAASDHARRQVSVGAVELDEEFVEITVQDTGGGLTEDARANAFEAFFTTKPDGMGMGLAICRTIIESHGGRISMVSNPDHGAACRFTLPKHGSDDRDQ